VEWPVSSLFREGKILDESKAMLGSGYSSQLFVLHGDLRKGKRELHYTVITEETSHDRRK
jgi:hypothetical protein